MKALLNTSVRAVTEQSEFNDNDRCTRRMTRSRVSIFQHPNEVQDLVTQVKIVNTRKPSVNNINELVNEYTNKMNPKGKQKRESLLLGSIKDVFKVVSIIETKTKSKPLKERTNNKTEIKIGESNQSDDTEKAFTKRSRLSEPKIKPTFTNAKNDKKSSAENIKNEFVPNTFDNISCNSSKNEMENSCSQDINNVVDVKDGKPKRKGRKKNLEKQGTPSDKIYQTRETLIETISVELKSDQKPKTEKKRRDRKQKKDKIINNSDVEVRTSDVNSPKEPVNRKRGKAKSELFEAPNNKDISGVSTMSGISLLNMKNISMSFDEKHVDASIDRKHSKRSSKVSLEKNIVKNRDSVDLFADEMEEANHADDLSSISGKSKYVIL